MDYKVIFDDGEVEYKNADSFLSFVQNLQRANQEDPNLSKRWKNMHFNLDHASDENTCILFVQWAGFSVHKFNCIDDYYVDLAIEEYGSAVRDNNRASLIELGKELV